MHWCGLQSCRAQVGQKAIETTSDETSIDDYSMSKTQVEIRGVQLEPTSSFSCGPIALHAAVTHSDGELTTFGPSTPEAALSRQVVRTLTGFRTKRPIFAANLAFIAHKLTCPSAAPGRRSAIELASDSEVNRMKGPCGVNTASFRLKTGRATCYLAAQRS